MLLSALLLTTVSPPVAAQTTVPATPASALPAPATPATVSTAPATPAASLMLSAPVGASVELVTTSSSRTSMGDVQVSALPGSKVTAAQVEEARRSVTQGLNRASSAQTTMTGKAFYKVASRDAAGNVTLISSMVQNVPATPAQKAQVVDLRFTQTVAPDGKVSGLKVETANPMMQAMFAQLTPEKLQQIADQNGSKLTGVYGTPLVVGEPHSTTVSLDAQDLLSSVIRSMAGARAQDLFGDIKASPMTVTTTTTYRGLDAQGQHLFESNSSYGNWKISVSSKDKTLPMTINAELLSVQSKGTSAYLPSGLPVGGNVDLQMKMKMTVAVEGLQVTMVMTSSQQTTMKRK